MGFGGFYLIDGPGGGCGGFSPPRTPTSPDPPPPPGAAPPLPTCTGGFGAGPGGAFPDGCT